MGGKDGHSEPGIFGGYTHYDGNGKKIGSSEPDIFGGYTNYDEKGRKIGHTDPDIFGGYNTYDNKGHKTGHSDPDIFGGYTHYDSKGRKIGTSDPEILGGYHHHSSRPSGSSGGCYIATCVYGSYDCPQVWTLRRFRDYHLAKTPAGRLFIRVYYAVSPGIVRRFGEKEAFRKFWRRILDRKVGKLRKEGYEDTPYRDN